MTENAEKQSGSPPTTDEEDDGSFKEENFIESLTSQIDSDALEELIAIQKKSLERFEKTNEMLATCKNLTERRLEDAKKNFQTGKEIINSAKADLESVFQRLRNLKAILADKYPEIYVEQSEQVEQQFPQEEED
ncbi:KxDL domain-containing protein [Aphelenchoides bicaudatus]|nr:KxDL domain-containing protein [Aphelenchoides bicaudatus]